MWPKVAEGSTCEHEPPSADDELHQFAFYHQSSFGGGCELARPLLFGCKSSLWSSRWVELTPRGKPLTPFGTKNRDPEPPKGHETPGESLLHSKNVNTFVEENVSESDHIAFLAT